MRDYGYLSVFYQRMPDLMSKFLEHIYLTGISIFFGCLVAIPIGVCLAKISINWIKSITFNVINIFQAIPSLALLAIIATILGFGIDSAIMALFRSEERRVGNER